MMAGDAGHALSRALAIVAGGTTDWNDSDSVVAAIAGAIRAAVEEERESCACIADTYASTSTVIARGMERRILVGTGAQVAAAIRARGKQGKRR